MKEMKSYIPGTFCWVDLTTIGAEGAKKFYTELFGWEAVDEPAGEGMVYTMLMLNGKPVAGLYEMGPDQKEMNLPPHWMSYVSVEDADATLKKVEELGGTVTMQAIDVMEEGRMGLLQDPTGAFLSVWQPKKHVGASYRNVPGAMCWHELATNEPVKAKEFFGALFGWEGETRDMGGNEYTTFKNQGNDAAGMYKMPAEMKDVPPHWLPYFLVN